MNSLRLTGIFVFCATFAAASIAAAQAATEVVVYSFGSGADGSQPLAGLIQVKGTLYGTTGAGGALGKGTVFALNAATGTETVLHSFGHGRDGSSPLAGLVNLNGLLYGTTHAGGAYKRGTVFSIDRATGAESVVYAFCTALNCADGRSPAAGLVHVNGTLYGTTEEGGNCCGTVYSLDPSTGAEKVLYSFCSQQNCTDGAYPLAALHNHKGTLYGTNVRGGDQVCLCGAVFAWNIGTGTETTVFSFNGANGMDSMANLIDVQGTLYGTAAEGGTGGCGGLGCGTVFALNPNTGKETTLHSFVAGADGWGPYAGMIDVNGTLYGTTQWGGETGCTWGCGTVFSIDPNTGAETVVYSFQGGTDGAYPQAGLINVNGTLYGTTSVGGAHNGGTAFALTP